LPSLSKSSIEVGLIVCVIVSSSWGVSWGVLMNLINTIIQNALILNHFILIKLDLGGKKKRIHILNYFLSFQHE
jgi:hypothetical protein